MTCKICYGLINALENLDVEMLRVAEELIRLKNIDGLDWLMMVRSAAQDHDWSNLTYRAWVLHREANGVDVVPLLWRLDGFAKKHGVELKAQGFERKRG